MAATGDIESQRRDHWLSVDLRHLAALAAIAREGSFSAAADSLGYVQSAVSQQISYLERLVGARLLERTRGPTPVSLTAEGRVLLGHVEAILEQMQVAQGELDALMDGTPRAAHIGVHESAESRVAAIALEHLGRLWPHVELSVRGFATAADLSSLLEGGVIDVAVADVELAPDTCEVEEIVYDPFVLVGAKADPALAPTLGGLAAMPLIGYRPAMSVVDARLAGAGLRARWVFSSEQSATVTAVLNEGHGSAILPRVSITPGELEARMVDLDALFEARVLGLIWRADRREEALIETLRAEMRTVLRRLADEIAPQ